MSIPWLQDLEDRVREAGERLGDLRDENARLEERIQELESKLEATSVTSDETGAWKEERDEIRGRVEKLVDHLKGLLDG